MRHISTRLTLIGLITVAAASPGFGAAAKSFYVETRVALSQSGLTGPIPISGLNINLPATSAAYNAAIVTLNMPNLYLTRISGQTGPMSGLAQVVAPFAPEGVVYAEGQIGCDTGGITTSGKKPLSIVLEVPLGSAGQNVEAEWFSTSGDTINTDTFASLSAILVRK